MRPRQQKALLIGIGLMVCGLVVNASIIYRQTRQMHEDSFWVAHTHQALEGLERFISTVKDAETGQRGYVITGQPSYLEYYDQARNHYDAEIGRIASLTADNPSQRGRIPRLKELSAAKFAEMGTVLSARKEAGFDAAQKLISANDGKRTMDALRDVVGEMQSEERKLLAERQQVSDSAYRSALWRGVVVALLGIAGFGGFVWLLQRHLATTARTSAQLHEQRELLQATLVSIGDAVIATDAKGKITFLNAVAQHLTGWTFATAKGRPLDQVFRIVNEESRQPVENPALRALQEGKIMGLANHTILIAQDGKEWPIDDSAAPIRNQGGGIVGAILVFREISDRKHQESELRHQAKALEDANRRMGELVCALQISDDRFRLATAAVQGLVYDCDPTTGHVERTEGLYATLGYRPDEVPPTMDWWVALVHPDDREKTLRAAERQWRESDRCVLEYRVRHRDGRYIHVLDHALGQRNSEGRLTRYVGWTQDVTSIKEYERALEEADRRKDEFLATLAHELRNPITPISNALQLWTFVENDRERMDQLRTMMERQVQQMTRLIDDLMDVSRITRGKIQLHKQKVDVRSVVSGAVESIQPFIEACGHKLTATMPSSPLSIEGDVARLIQVFGNVLHNAAKYTGHDGVIWVTIEREQDRAVVRIRDNGPGIPGHMLTQVFEMFRQVDQTLDRSHGGLGIGLTLVKRLVELHGGTVEARSEGPGKGSEFLIRLPALAIEECGQGPSETRHVLRNFGSLPRHRILVVDDVEASAQTLSMMLQAIGQEVATAYDGHAALEWTQSNRPDVVFLDIAMPGMNGYEVAKQIRNQDKVGGVLLVALTGYGQEEDRRRAAEAGFNHHLTKPASLESLCQLLMTRRALDLNSSNRSPSNA